MSDSDDKPFTVSFSTNKEDSPWWAKDISSVLRPEARKMLDEYARVPRNELIDHIAKAVRPPFTTTLKRDRHSILTFYPKARPSLGTRSICINRRPDLAESLHRTALGA